MVIKMNLQVSEGKVTMSSIELADLLGYEKKEVNKKIRAMFGEIKVRETFSPTLRANGQVDFYSLPELESKMFVAKYDIEYLETITQFWIDKGKSAQPLWIQQLSPEAKVAIQDLSNQVTAANAEVDRLQGVCNTITAQFARGTTAPVFCRQLNGVNVQQVNNKLIEIGMLLKTSRGIEPTSYARDKYFKVQYIDKENDRTGWSGQVSETTLTLTGAKWLYRAYLSSKLPMKKNWDGKFVHMEFN